MRRRALSVIVAPLLLLALAGCGSAAGAGSGDGSPSGTTTSTDASGSASASTSAAPQPYTGRVLAVGDSVMLGAARCMEPLGIKVDAEESRAFVVGSDLLTSKAERGTLPDRVVVHLGTNGPIASSDLEDLVSALEDHEVYWINVHLPDYDEYYYADEVNALLEQTARDYPNLHVIDWDAEAEAHPAWLYGDHTHLTDKGCQGFARMVDDAVRAPLPDATS